jgi:SAM-dependent methyltransferase
VRSVFASARQIVNDLVVARVRSVSRSLLERIATALAERGYATSGSIARLPFRDEGIELPRPLSVNGSRIDIIGDLSEFCGLPRDAIERELTTRSFRTEWHATRPELRVDHWYYLSAKGYLFANATHFPDPSFVTEHVAPHVSAPARVLDFGAGTGNLSLRLAAAGYKVDAMELSALQRDFIRFRVERHALADDLGVLDWWSEPPKGAYDAVVAVDVLEHLADARHVLDEQLLPALKPSGLLIENSPFVINAANPMHHQDFGLVEYLHSRGFKSLSTAADGTRVWIRSDGR